MEKQNSCGMDAGSCEQPTNQSASQRKKTNEQARKQACIMVLETDGNKVCSLLALAAIKKHSQTERAVE